MATVTDRMQANTTAALNADIVRVAAGDRDALRRVYDATSAKLFGICLRFSVDRDAAEDALQESYVKVWRRAGRFDPARAGAITWLCLIARGTAIDGARQANRATAAVEAAREHVADVEPPATDRRALEECLDTLEPDPRRFILSAFFDGYTYDELAHRSDVPLGTMKSRIRRALLALRRCLDDA